MSGFKHTQSTTQTHFITIILLHIKTDCTNCHFFSDAPKMFLTNALHYIHVTQVSSAAHNAHAHFNQRGIEAIKVFACLFIVTKISMCHNYDSQFL